MPKVEVLVSAWKGCCESGARSRRRVPRPHFLKMVSLSPSTVNSSSHYLPWLMSFLILVWSLEERIDLGTLWTKGSQPGSSRINRITLDSGSFGEELPAFPPWIPISCFMDEHQKSTGPFPSRGARAVLLEGQPAQKQTDAFGVQGFLLKDSFGITGLETESSQCSVRHIFGARVSAISSGSESS